VSSGEVVVLWVSGKLLCCGLWGKGGTYGPNAISVQAKSGLDV